MPLLIRKNGELTNYGFSCGYVEKRGSFRMEQLPCRLNDLRNKKRTFRVTGSTLNLIRITVLSDSPDDGRKWLRKCARRVSRRFHLLPCDSIIPKVYHS